MKKLFFAVSALAALALLAPRTGFAQHMYTNQVGLYQFADGTGNTYTMDVGSAVDVFLVLTRPADEFDVPYAAITAFEVQLNFNPAGNMFKLLDALPPNSLNIGDNSHIGDGYLEYAVGIASPWAVVDESVVLISFQFMTTTVGLIEVTLSPISLPSAPDQMVFLPVDPPLIQMFPSGGSTDSVVWAFNGEVVAIEDASFGSVKALYR